MHQSHSPTVATIQKYILGADVKETSLKELSGGGLTGEVTGSKLSGGSYRDGQNRGASHPAFFLADTWEPWDALEEINKMCVLGCCFESFLNVLVRGQP